MMIAKIVICLGVARPSSPSWIPGHVPNGWTLDDLTHLLNGFQIIATPQGLCLKLMREGFWFIPYSDIDAY